MLCHSTSLPLTKYAMHLTTSIIYLGINCCIPGCKNVLGMDGSMKYHRDVCKATEAGLTNLMVYLAK